MATRQAPKVFVLLLLQACAGQVTGEGDPAGPGAAGRSPGPGANVPPLPGSPGGTGMATPAATLPPQCQDKKIRPPRAPLRRLTRFEYDNTVRDLLGDTTSPGQSLPAEELGNGFGNDAATQAVSSLLAEQYSSLAEAIAARATQSPAALGKLAPCARAVSAASQPAMEETCARTIIEGFVPQAFRRALGAEEVEAFVGLYRSVRALADASFASAVAAVLEAVLASPDFLYRVEFGAADPAQPGLLRPTGDEMATRLSYFLWGTAPDPPLRAAARAGTLQTAPGVQAQAMRLLADPRSHRIVRFFFDNLLPISALSDLERDPMIYPGFTPAVGALMREETQRLVENEIFAGGGSWPSLLTAPYTFVNGPLAAFYGLPPVRGAAFAKVALEPGKRLGLLTQASVLTGTTPSNHTNPVLRGSFIVQKLLCLAIPLPDASIAEKVKAPDPYSGKTARERFSKHQSDPVCRGCHGLMDPVGLALENFDAVGLYRTQENGVTIDASGALPGLDGIVNGGAELAQKLATAPEAQRCFARHWLELAYGRTLGDDDACVQAAVNLAFAEAGHDVRQLLLALTQTDAFLYTTGSP